MRYRKLQGYKYQLTKDEVFHMPFLHEYDIERKFYSVHNGDATAKSGYAWDGCSGPTKDDSKNMFPGCGHDLGYELIRQGLINPRHREDLDEWFRQACKARNMCNLRLWYYFKGVRKLAAFAAKRREKKEPKNIIYEVL